jgi:type II secretion system protein G
MKNNITIPRGFTLIELLIVIAIIGVLATLIMANFAGVRNRARDAQRKSDLKQIQLAFETYRADQGAYPTTLPACGSSLTAGSTVYMQKIPCDPLNTTPYLYRFTGTTTAYTLVACLENANDSQKDAALNVNCTNGSVSYTLNNP